MACRANVGRLQRPYNRQRVGWDRSQRAGGGGALGSGKGDPTGAAAALGGFGFFGLARIGFGGGPACLSSATTGLGSTFAEAGVLESPGLLMTCIGLELVHGVGHAETGIGSGNSDG